MTVYQSRCRRFSFWADHPLLFVSKSPQTVLRRSFLTRPDRLRRPSRTEELQKIPREANQLPLLAHIAHSPEAKPTESSPLLNLTTDRFHYRLPHFINRPSRCSPQLVCHYLARRRTFRRRTRSRLHLLAVPLASRCNVPIHSGLTLIGHVRALQ